MKKVPFVAGLLAAAALSGLATTPAQAQPTAGQTPAALPTPTASRPAIYRPVSDRWFLRNSATTGVADASFQYGLSSDIHFMGDWDGDGTDTPGVYRKGVFYLRNVNTTGEANITVIYGLQSGDQPVVGDWDGNGTDTIGVYRTAQSTWFLRNNNTTGFADVSFQYGSAALGDQPFAGDWNADGVDTPAVYRFTSDGDGDSSGNGHTLFERNADTTGVADDAVYVPNSERTTLVVGDFDANGADEPDTFSNSNGNWTTTAGTFNYGVSTDQPFAWNAGPG